VQREVREEEDVPRLQRRHHAGQPLGQRRPLVHREEAAAPAMPHEAERVRRLRGAVQRAWRQGEGHWAGVGGDGRGVWARGMGVMGAGVGAAAGGGGRAGERASGRAGERASGRAGERASGRAHRAKLDRAVGLVHGYKGRPRGE